MGARNARGTANVSDDTKGWFQISHHARWHFFAPWEANEFLLIPACKREIILQRVDRLHLRSRVDLPNDAKLCRGCTAASDEWRAA